MSFSTWRQDFREHKRGKGATAMLVLGVIGAPIAWLASLEAAYVLTYPVCWGAGRVWLAAAALSPMAVCALAAWLMTRVEPQRRSAEAEQPWPKWLATMSLLMSAFFAIVALAMVIPVVGLDPCR
jgi:hypothetical protein